MTKCEGPNTQKAIFAATKFFCLHTKCEIAESCICIWEIN